jgi:hypothetical protein
MPKNRDRGNCEAKKPKATKKPAPAGSAFLRPQPAASAPAKPKDTAK